MAERRLIAKRLKEVRQIGCCVAATIRLAEKIGREDVAILLEAAAGLPERCVATSPAGGHVPQANSRHDATCQRAVQ